MWGLVYTKNRNMYIINNNDNNNHDNDNNNNGNMLIVKFEKLYNSSNLIF